MGLMQISAFHFYKIGKIRDPISNNIRTLIPGPLYHAGVQIAVLPFFLGGTAVPMSKFDPELMLKLIQDERINWTFVAPTMLERILALPEALKSQYDLSSMRVIICAAAPCPPRSSARSTHCSAARERRMMSSMNTTALRRAA
ncbi:AMP-binding protein [Alcanivorax sp. IO_7]|nr:AMP-binding protein [Alcanivorax sp. IO_7]